MKQVVEWLEKKYVLGIFVDLKGAFVKSELECYVE